MGKLESIFQYRRLSNRIATAGQPNEEEFRAIAGAGFRVVVNLGLEDADYALPDEKGLVESLGLIYEHIPVLWEAPTESDLHHFFQVLDRHAGKKMFIHCAANKRVSVFMMLYRVLMMGWTTEAAFSEMEQVWHPNEIWQSFINKILAAFTEA